MSGNKRRRLPLLTVNRLIPNALTLLGLCAGVTAIRLALLGRWELAVAAVVVAMLMDALDGRIARLMRVSSEFGAQLDSLADVINFGVVPGLMVYLWSLNGLGGLGWAVVVVFIMCCALRLARFNTGLGVSDPLPWSDRFFTGVPAPGAAGLALLPMVLSFELGEEVLGSAALNGIMMLGIAALMVSKIPTFSAKRIRLPHRYLGLVLVGVGAFAAFLASMPWVTLSLAGLAYLISIPVAVTSYRRLEAAFPAETEAEEEVDAGPEG
ncbi:MAG: phosphatidylcholine/phosphatidylserine synthase [Kiloniellales bacterium]|jgi:CDP-diacylglycerol--serine O-phosphatidyltransferase